MEWTSAQVLTALYVLVGVMLVVVLYHVLFIVVDLRKVMRRVENITKEVEAVVMKPLSMTDAAMQWILDRLQNGEGNTADKVFKRRS